MDEKKVLAIVDADSLVFHCSKEDLKESLDILDERVQNILTETKADYYSMFISMGNYFRHTIDPSYKANRKKYGGTPLLWTKVLKNYLMEKYGAVAGRNVEADDLCKYFYNRKYISAEPMDSGIIAGMSYESMDKETLFMLPDGVIPLSKDVKQVKVILCTPDKDLLHSIVGAHFNYSYKLQDKENPDSLIKGWWIETNFVDTEADFWRTMISGDPGDGIIGLHGCGDAFAKKLYSNLGNDTYQSRCLDAYIKHHKDIARGIYEFQKMYRLLHILDSESDFLREVGYIPEFQYRDVVKKETEQTQQETIF